MALELRWSTLVNAKNSFKRSIENFMDRKIENSLFAEGTSSYVQSVLEKLELNWFGYKRYAQELDSSLSHLDDDFIDLDDQADEEMNRISKIYDECKSVIGDRIKLLTKSIDAPVPKSTEVQLPNFKGTYYDYTYFRQAVQERVLNTDYPPYTKIDLIFKALQGDAKKIVGCVQGQGHSELKRIWNTLEETYFNPYLIARAHMGKIIDLPFLNEPSIIAYRNMITEVKQHLHALSGLNLKVEFWDTMIIELLLRRLDPIGSEKWETTRDIEVLPSLSAFLSFLESRIVVISNINVNLHFTSTQSTRLMSMKRGHDENVAQSSTTRVHSRNQYRDGQHSINRYNNFINESKITKDSPSACSYVLKPPEICIMNCQNKKAHHLWHCKRFRQYDLEHRLQIVQENKLCKRCLSSKHHVSKCNARKCNDCHDDIHNIILCPKYMVLAKVNITQERPLYKFQKRQRSYSQKLPEISSASENNETLNLSSKSKNVDKYMYKNYDNDFSNFVSTFPVDREIGKQIDIILPTAQVRITDNGISSEPIRALVDSGSNINLITNNCIQRLGLRIEMANTYISGVGNIININSKGFINLNVQHRHFCTTFFLLRFTVVSRISSNIPQHKINNLFEEITSDELADADYCLPGKIDMLLGAGIWARILTGEIIRKRFDNNHIIAQKSIFGWIISGGAVLANSNIQYKSLHLNLCEDEQHQVLEKLDQSIRRFWEIETIPEIKIRSSDEQIAENIFASSHSRDENGRYCVSIPFKTDAPLLGNSRQIAFKRFLQLENKLNKYPERKKMLNDFILDYIDKGHMVLAPPAPLDSSQAYYIPYHAINQKKFRVVFDASCRTSTGASLNDTQHSGEKLQDDLGKLFLKFRLRKFAVSADVVKMFRQVKVNQEHWNFPRIFWRPETSSPIREYQITVVVWGMTSASFNAVRALRQCAIDGKFLYPLASQATLEDFYVDDFLSGADSVTELLSLYHQMNELMESGGFILDKWSSNFSNIPGQRIGNNREVNVISDTGLLGMVWNPKTDRIKLKLMDQHIKLSQNPTKADIVSNISKVYDPSGLFGPTILIGKCIMQDFWREPNIKWKDPAPQHLSQRCAEYLDQLNCLTKITVERWVHTSNEILPEIHIFTDASERAYGAAAYIRTEEASGRVIVKLLTSKSRVAPLKTQSIPRLELLGALLGSKLLSYVRSSTGYSNVPAYLWTDSTIVLQWINMDLSRMKSYVNNRISQILEYTGKTQWGYVRSKDNPADILSRGASAIALKNSVLWWNGPDWLIQNKDRWPNVKSNFAIRNNPEVMNECKSLDKNTVLVTISQTNLNLPPGNAAVDELSILNHQGKFESLLKRRSTLAGILRVTAYVLRFVNNIKKSLKDTSKLSVNNKIQSPSIKTPSPDEKEHVLIVWARICQRIAFSKEIEALSNCSNLPKNSKLLKLTPRWFKNDSTLRLAGRIENSHLTHDQAHQIIIPNDHHFALLLVRDAHNRTMHGGPQLCIAFLRQRWWILNVKIIIKKHIYKDCISCIRFRKESAQQLMGSLPESRITIAPGFSRVGIDFAGPFTLRKTAASVNALRKAAISLPKEPVTIKCWVVVFVCLVTRAIHLDVVRGLNVEAFLDCFVKFTARRGLCNEIWSDNGTTFVGANNELKRVLEGWNNEFPHQQLADFGTTWNFITPGAPFRGGIWEAGVKSFKHHLKRTVGSRILTADQLYTLVVQIEACLNARPLFAQTDDPSDLSPITPAHLVIGRSTLQRPVCENLIDTQDNRLTLWGYQQKMYQQFWKSWKEDYIISLQIRNKWYSPQRNIQVNDMVLLRDENTPPSKWPIGRVVDTIISKDGLVRSVAVKIPVMKYDKDSKQRKISITTLKRPIQKLCILFEDNIQPTTSN